MKCSALACLLTIALASPAGAKGSALSKAKPASPTPKAAPQTEKKAVVAKAKAKIASDIEDIELDKDPVDDIELDEDPIDDAELDKETVEKVPQSLQALFLKTDALEKSRDFAGVVTHLRPLLVTLPRKGLLQIARAYRAQGDFTNEAHSLELVVAKNPKDYVSQTLLGDAYLNTKRYEAAGIAYQTARTLNNRYRPAYDGQWALLERDDSKYEARTLVLDMIKTFGPDAKTSAAICKMYSDENFLEKATEACRSAISLDPKNPSNYVHLAMSLRDQEHKTQAEKLIDDAAKRFPSSEDVQVLAGEMKANDKNFAVSYKLFKQAVSANPKSARAQTGFATSAFELQKHSEAIDAFKIACKLDRKMGREFRAASIALKNNKDPKWVQYQSGLEACE